MSFFSLAIPSHGDDVVLLLFVFVTVVTTVLSFCCCNKSNVKFAFVESMENPQFVTNIRLRTQLFIGGIFFFYTILNVFVLLLM